MIIKNQSFLQRQSDKYIRGELSNVAAVVQSTEIMLDYFSIDVDASPTIDGFKNIEDFIGPESPIVYNEIEDLPFFGVQDLVIQAQFDEELGYEEDFQSEGMIMPNTIVPKEDDCFLIVGNKFTALYKVTGTEPVTVRTNPFVQITFRLYSRDPEVIKQLRRQVKDVYCTTVTSIGTDKTMLVNKKNLFKIQDCVTDYLQLLNLYQSLFYKDRHAAFIYDGIADEEGNMWSFLDLILWKILFDSRIGMFDSITVYSNNNFNTHIDIQYASCPDQYVDLATIQRSILYRIFTKDHRHKLDEFKFPQASEPDPRIGKFTGKFLTYFESYGKELDCNLMCTTCPVWDDEFVQRLVNDDPYPEVPLDVAYPTKDSSNGCCTTAQYVDGVEVRPYNPYLRNAVIAYYNNREINWEKLEIVQEVTSENYYLIPIVLAGYRDYIENLQK